MKKLTLILLMAMSMLSKAGPLEVAQNVFQEFRQVEELIRQIEEVIKQIEQQAEMIENLSGKDLYQMTADEIELLSWLPVGDQLLDPNSNSEYGINFQELAELLDLQDPIDLLGMENPIQYDQAGPLAIARKAKQQTTIASAAYSKTFMNQFAQRVDVISEYLTDLNEAETLKNSVDLNARVTAQAVINQIEINRTMAMLLKQKTADVQEQLAQQRYNLKFIQGD